MKEEEREKRLLEKARSLLEDPAQIEKPTLDRLQEIRREALDAAGEGGWKTLFFPRWKAWGALATAAAAGLAAIVWMDLSSPEIRLKHVEDLEILTSQEPLDVYGELDFYRWLAGKETETGIPSWNVLPSKVQES